MFVCLRACAYVRARPHTCVVCDASVCVCLCLFVCLYSCVCVCMWMRGVYMCMRAPVRTCERLSAYVSACCRVACGYVRSCVSASGGECVCACVPGTGRPVVVT